MEEETNRSAPARGEEDGEGPPAGEGRRATREGAEGARGGEGRARRRGREGAERRERERGSRDRY